MKRSNVSMQLALERVLLVGVVMLAFVISFEHGSMVQAYPTTRKHPVAMEVENPEEVLSVLDNLMQNILVAIEYAQQEKSNEIAKRGIDLGLTRGYSASKAAKHLIGMKNANFVGGPGRRR